MADEDKWGVDSDGGVGPFFDAIAYEKEFDDNRENPMSMGGEGHAEVEYQAGKLIELSNSDIHAMKKEIFYYKLL